MRNVLTVDPALLHGLHEQKVRHGPIHDLSPPMSHQRARLKNLQLGLLNMGRGSDLTAMANTT